MWWMMAVKAANGLLQGMAGRVEAERNNEISQVNAQAGNSVRVAKNAAVAASNTLARWVQSVSNNRRLDQGGDAIEANAVNYRRASDAGLTHSFSSSIRDSEQAGVQAAQAAASGVDGNVVDMINTSVALRNSIVKQGIEDSGNYADYDAAQRAGNIMHQMVGGLDNSVVLDSLDYNVDFAKTQPVFSHFENALKGLGSTFGATGGQGELNQKYQSNGDSYNFGSTFDQIMGRNRQGITPASDSDYRNGSDIESDNYDTGAKFGFEASKPSQYEFDSDYFGKGSTDYSSIYSLGSN